MDKDEAISHAKDVKGSEVHYNKECLEDYSHLIGWSANCSEPTGCSKLREKKEDQECHKPHKAYEETLKIRLFNSGLIESNQSNLFDASVIVGSFFMLMLLTFVNHDYTPFQEMLKPVVQALFSLGVVLMLCSFKASEEWHMQEFLELEKMLMSEKENPQKKNYAEVLTWSSFGCFISGLLLWVSYQTYCL